MATTTEQIAKLKREEISLQIGRAFDSLVVKKENAHLPEHVFEQHFLPFFAGELDNPNLKERDVITDWISIAGTPLSEVDIVDNSGLTIFTVPAIFDSNIIEHVNRRAGNSLRDIMIEYELRKGGVPVQANNYLNDALATKSEEIAGDTSHTLVTAERWDGILKRYGKPTLSQGSDGNKSPEAEPGDDLEYD